MINIVVRVRNKIARLDDPLVRIVADNTGYTIDFALDDEWNAYDAKTARFEYQGGIYTDVIFSGNRVEMPAVSRSEWVKVGLYAGELHTSTPATIGVRKSILSNSGIPADPHPDVYDQLMEKINSMDGGLSEEKVAAAIEAYFAENPVKSTYTVAVTYDAEADAYTADKTFAEISAANEAGQNVQLSYDGAYFQMNWIAEDSVSFGATYSADGSSLQWDTVMMSADGSIYFDTVEAGQADWNQDDENASDYIKNRTHWAKDKLVSSAIITDESATQGTMTAAANGYSYDKLYAVEINGMRYDALSFSISSAYGGRWVYLGEDPSSGEVSDFRVFVVVGGDIYPDITSPETILSWEVSDKYLPLKSLNIYESETHKLDARYLPDEFFDAVDAMEAAKTEVVVVTFKYRSAGITADKTYDEVVSAAKSGINVYGIYGTGVYCLYPIIDDGLIFISYGWGIAEQGYEFNMLNWTSNGNIETNTIEWRPFEGVGTTGLVPAPSKEETTHVLASDGTWLDVTSLYEPITGTLADLTTTDKTNLVAAINEVNSKAGAGSGGESDTSLGITSANVGDTIKVKAADENGKPTEWEAMSDSWELIFEDETTEDLVRWNRSTDNDGNSFSLSKAWVVIFTPRSEVEDITSLGRAVSCVPDAYWGSGGGCSISSVLPATNTSGLGSYDQVKFEIIGGYEVATAKNASFNTTNVIGTPKQDSSSGWGAFAFPQSIDDDKLMKTTLAAATSLTACAIYGYAANAVPKGTRIMLYGVRK